MCMLLKKCRRVYLCGYCAWRRSYTVNTDLSHLKVRTCSNNVLYYTLLLENYFTRTPFLNGLLPWVNKKNSPKRKTQVLCRHIECYTFFGGYGALYTRKGNPPVQCTLCTRNCFLYIYKCIHTLIRVPCTYKRYLRLTCGTQTQAMVHFL